MQTFKELYCYREMIANLIRKDLRGRYKGSVLGFLWTFINPLLQLIVYTMVFSVILQAGIDKYYLFLFVALIPWIFFSTCLVGGTTIIFNEKNLVTKIYFPREVLPIAFVTSNFVNMLYGFLVVLAVILLSGIKVNFIAWCYLPIVMIIEYIMGLGLVLIVSAVTVYLRDMQHILGIIAMAWQFMTPVMYSMDMVPEELVPLFMLNPMTSVIMAYRDILYYAMIPKLATMTLAAVFALITLVLGFVVFSKLKKGFAEEL